MLAGMLMMIGEFSMSNRHQNLLDAIAAESEKEPVLGYMKPRNALTMDYAEQHRKSLLSPPTQGHEAPRVSGQPPPPTNGAGRGLNQVPKAMGKTTAQALEAAKQLSNEEFIEKWIAGVDAAKNAL